MYYPYFFFFFFNDTATTEIYTLSLHDALPISLLETDGGPIPLPDRSADVMLLARHGLAGSLSHDRTTRDEFERLLKPGGVAYAEFRPSLYRLAATRAVERAFG